MKYQNLKTNDKFSTKTIYLIVLLSKEDILF